MTRNIMTACTDYGMVQKDCDYEVIDEGIDWYLIKIAGKSQYVFNWVLE